MGVGGGGGVGKLWGLWSGTKRLHSAITLIKIYRQACIMMIIIAGFFLKRHPLTRVKIIALYKQLDRHKYAQAQTHTFIT